MGGNWRETEIKGIEDTLGRQKATNSVLSGLWIESRFGKLWAGSSREVALEKHREKDFNILNNVPLGK